MAAPRKHFKDLKDDFFIVYIPSDFKKVVEQIAKENGSSASGLIRQWSYKAALEELKNSKLD